MNGKRILILIPIGLLLLWAGSGIAVYHFLPSWPERGTFGDMFGFVNSLFSGLAFLGLVYTIALQREELALQRQELELTRTELARAATAQESSGKSLETQARLERAAAVIGALSSLQEMFHQELLRAQSIEASRESIDALQDERNAVFRSLMATLAENGIVVDGVTEKYSKKQPDEAA